jgi:hypothetical protein
MSTDVKIRERDSTPAAMKKTRVRKYLLIA